MSDDFGRARHDRRKRIPQTSLSRILEFLNPYPWMSEPEAMVHLELERRQVPFSWRYFDGHAPTFQMLLKGYHPEFTLKEYKTVIIVLGSYFGTLPGVLDRAALAQAALEQDGWKAVIFLEQEIRHDVRGLVDEKLPELRHPTIRGAPRERPFGRPTFMLERRQRLSGFALLRQKFIDYLERRGNHVVRRRKRVSSVDSGRHRRGIRTSYGPDSGSQDSR